MFCCRPFAIIKARGGAAELKTTQTTIHQLMDSSLQLGAGWVKEADIQGKCRNGEIRQKTFGFGFWLISQHMCLGWNIQNEQICCEKTIFFSFYLWRKQRWEQTHLWLKMKTPQQVFKRFGAIRNTEDVSRSCGWVRGQEGWKGQNGPSGSTWNRISCEEKLICLPFSFSFGSWNSHRGHRGEERCNLSLKPQRSSSVFSDRQETWRVRALPSFEQKTVKIGGLFFHSSKVSSQDKFTVCVCPTASYLSECVKTVNDSLFHRNDQSSAWYLWPNPVKAENSIQSLSCLFFLYSFCLLSFHSFAGYEIPYSYLGRWSQEKNPSYFRQTRFIFS